MIRTLDIKSASIVPLEAFAAAYNTAFAGYLFPISLTAATLAQRVRIEHIDLNHSLLAYDDDEIAGTAMLAIRGETGRLESIGLAPEQRGRGRSRELLDALIERARGCGLRKLTLEVLSQNTAALRLYRRAGLHIVRDLLILERVAQTAMRRQHKPLKEAAPLALLRHFVRLHLHQPTWTRDLASLLVMQRLRGFYLGEAEAPEAYALLVARPDDSSTIIDLAAADGEQATALCAALCGMPLALRIFNEPEDSIFIAPLMAHGFIETNRQYEMACQL